MHPMSYRLAMLRSAQCLVRRASFIGCAALCVTIACLLPVFVGIGSALSGHRPWRGSAAGRPLQGYTDSAPRPAFNWWNRTFQTTFTAAFDERMPLRNWMVRINNQLDYSILRVNRMYAGNIVVGKNGVLFEKPYILETLGYASPVRDERIRRMAERLKHLHQLLRQRGISLLVIGTPGKVSFMRDAVPESILEYRPGAPRNYDRLAKIFSDEGVPFVDGRAEMRGSNLASRGSFFPKGGVHWTLLGAYAALERPVARLLSEFAPSDLTRVVLDDVTITQPAIGTDADLLSLANLLFPDRRYGTTAVKVHLEGPPLPKAIVLVGTSFIGQIQSILLQARVAPRVLRFEYLKLFIQCANCTIVEEVPTTWPQIILNEASAVILEINEAQPLPPYLDTFLDGLIPILEKP
jgi:alginate O-acetyltransferase complex protein AlgJ